MTARPELSWDRGPDGTHTAVGAPIRGGGRRHWSIRNERGRRRWHIHSVLVTEATYHGDTYTLAQAKDFIARADAFLAQGGER